MWKNVTYVELLMHEFCWLKLGVSYFVMENCIFIIGFGKITLQQKTVVLAKKKAVGERKICIMNLLML